MTCQRIDAMINTDVQLRGVEQTDLSRLYEFSIDPDANRLAATIPRSLLAFEAHWKKIFEDTTVVARAITLGNVLVGNIGCFKSDGVYNVGYWIGKEFWGQGIASRALELLLKEIQTRPLYATVATSNPASLRVLQKCGFVIESVHMSPATDRYLECEEALLALKR